ncbi:MAG: putative General secretion pathway protein GspG [Candidatus Levybacteria bacterium]|nr:putative General secretion pathway protein GspG [Candidatus Levybacteria bacterium]
MKTISNLKWTIYKRGVTLIELLVVIAVIGILAGGVAALVDPVAQIQKANDSRRKTDLNQIQKAFEVYYQDYGKYPDSSGYIIAGKTWGSPWTPYMGNLPEDPSSSKNYAYVMSNGQSYYLYASLDRGASDPQACNGGSPCANAGLASCGSGTCNYGVSSPNVSP